jgi:hypothetical protein
MGLETQWDNSGLFTGPPTFFVTLGGAYHFLCGLFTLETADGIREAPIYRTAGKYRPLKSCLASCYYVSLHYASKGIAPLLSGSSSMAYQGLKP